MTFILGAKFYFFFFYIIYACYMTFIKRERTVEEFDKVF